MTLISLMIQTSQSNKDSCSLLRQKSFSACGTGSCRRQDPRLLALSIDTPPTGRVEVLIAVLATLSWQCFYSFLTFTQARTFARGSRCPCWPRVWPGQSWAACLSAKAFSSLWHLVERDGTAHRDLLAQSRPMLSCAFLLWSYLDY